MKKPKPGERDAVPWAIKWREKSALDGERETLLGRYFPGLPLVPDHVAGQTVMLFKTRALARVHIRKHYAYIRQRSDLRQEPHGWKMPVAVRVSVEVREIP